MLQKGWNIYVVSWENDVDNYNHLTVNVGEDEQAARNIVAFLHDIATSGYDQCLNDSERNEIGTKFQKFVKANPTLFKDWDIETNDWYSTLEEAYYSAFTEWLYDFVGSGDTNADYDLRVIQDIKLTYVAEHIEWEDCGSMLYMKKYER